MRPAAAIIAPAPIDVDVDGIADQIIVALKDERSAATSAEDHETAVAHHQSLAVAARDTARRRRMEVGALLCKARVAWPERGPRAAGWGKFLARVRLDDATARRYMAEFRDPAGFAQQRAKSQAAGADTNTDDDRSERTPDLPTTVPSSAPALAESEQADAETPALRPGAHVTAAEVPKPANVNGGSKDPTRGTYCTPEPIAKAVGAWDLDPFTNPRSHIVSAEACMLERGDDGLLDVDQPGSYYIEGQGQGQATAGTRVWIQPPYEIVIEAIGHYGHTRFCALLRFDPSTEWFELLLARTAVICVPLERLPFEPPPDIGVEAKPAPYPHALFYADERDITDEIRRMCLVLRVERGTVDLSHLEKGAA